MDTFTWLEPWEAVTDDDPIWVAELGRELSASHSLAGLPLRLIARGKDDDALFAVEDGSARVAAVHLTWSRRQEQPPWPYAETFASLEEFGRGRMQPDHDALFGPSSPA